MKSSHSKFLINVNLVVFFILIAACQTKQKELVSNNIASTIQIAHYQNFPFANNPQFVEQMDFFSIYKKQANIVLLGNSHFFRVHWNELLERDDVANRGIGSDVSIGYLSRVKDVLALSPKVCFIEGGGNDIDHNTPIDSVAARLQQLVLTLKKHQVKPVLFAAFYATKDVVYIDFLNFGSPFTFYNDKIKELNVLLHDIAQKEKVHIIDFTTQLCDNGYLRSEFARPDGFHLNSGAYQIIKIEMMRTLRNLNI